MNIKEFLLNIWNTYKKLDVTWQTLIFTGLWTSFWKIICKLPKGLSILWLWLNRKFLYRFHPIERYQFTGCIRTANALIAFQSIFDYVAIEDIKKCVFKKHKNQIKNLLNKSTDNTELRSYFYDELSFIEKCHLHKLYVNVYKDYKRKEEQRINDFERNYYGPSKKFL